MFNLKFIIIKNNIFSRDLSGKRSLSNSSQEDQEEEKRLKFKNTGFDLILSYSKKLNNIFTLAWYLFR